MSESKAPDHIWAASDSEITEGIEGIWHVDKSVYGGTEYTRTDAIMSDPRVKALVEAASRMADPLEHGMTARESVEDWRAALAAIKAPDNDIPDMAEIARNFGIAMQDLKRNYNDYYAALTAKLEGQTDA